MNEINENINNEMIINIDNNSITMDYSKYDNDDDNDDDYLEMAIADDFY